jgi:hypothetical protein
MAVKDRLLSSQEKPTPKTSFGTKIKDYLVNSTAKSKQYERPDWLTKIFNERSGDAHRADLGKMNLRSRLRSEMNKPGTPKVKIQRLVSSRTSRAAKSARAWQDEQDAEEES